MERGALTPALARRLREATEEAGRLAGGGRLSSGGPAGERDTRPAGLPSVRNPGQSRVNGHSPGWDGRVIAESRGRRRLKLPAPPPIPVDDEHRSCDEPHRPDPGDAATARRPGSALASSATSTTSAASVAGATEGSGSTSFSDALSSAPRNRLRDRRHRLDDLGPVPGLARWPRRSASSDGSLDRTALAR